VSAEPIVLVGAGPHAGVVAEAVLALKRYEIVGLTDPDPMRSVMFGLAVIGGDDVLPALRARGVHNAVIAVGDNALREKLGAKVRRLGFLLPAIVHPEAFVSPSARIEEGAVVMARAVVGTGTIVRALAVVNTGAVIDHDGDIGVAAHVAPGCAIAGSVRVGARALVGVGSAVRPSIAIGADAIVAVGSAVVEAVPDGARVGGVPARPINPKPAG
jgi:sugar O-acyltransferase (sialic acid O-acetyltransferase NeuD family)